MVDPKPLLHDPELLGCRLVGAVRPLRLRIEGLQLREDALGLCALRTDLVRVRTRCRGTEQARKKQADHKCQERN